jgi:hypothetical protein
MKTIRNLTPLGLSIALMYLLGSPAGAVPQ